MRSTRVDENDGDLEQVIVMAKVLDPVERKGGMRLNSQMKEEVIAKAMAHGFDKKKADLQKEGAAICRAFFLKNFGAAVLKHAVAIKGTPFVLLDHDRYGRKFGTKDAQTPFMRWNVGGQTVDLPSIGLPQEVHSYDKKSFVIKDEALIERCRAYQDASEKLREKSNQTIATLQGMLSRITTYPSLEKNWPQGSKFYKHLPEAYPFRHQVPAVQIEQLNDALGL